MASHNQLGRRGEVLAADFLESKGYTILERNWRYRRAEVDIIALKSETLAIVEVKTRSSERMGAPQSFVGRKKIRLLVEAVNAYVRNRGINVEVRFDIVAIVYTRQGPKLQHLKDAFYHFD